jgi:hypothetical protein
MSSEVSKGLSEAYNSIYSQEKVDQRLTEKLESLITYFDENGYDVTDVTTNDLYEFYTSQGVDLLEKNIPLGQLAKLIDQAKGAAPGLQRAATGLLQTGQKAAQQTAGPILTGVSGRLQSAAQTGKDALKQASQVASQGPKGPLGQVGSGLRKAAELATGMAPGSGSRLRRSLVVGGTGGLLGSTGLGQQALDAAGRFIKGGTAAVMGGEKPKQEKPKSKPAPALPGFESFDPFETIKSHLLDEGYASTEDQAIAIMAHMSEGWKNSILNTEEN